MLINNIFEFNDHRFLQIRNTAMGMKISPSYVNIYGWPATKYFKQIPLWTSQRHMWYLLFFINIGTWWEHSAWLQIIYQQFSQPYQIHYRNFSHFHSVSGCTGADKTNQVSTKLYTKPTDDHCYLNRNSFYPSSSMNRSFIVSVYS